MGIEYAFVVPHPPLIVPDVGRGEERAISKTIEAYETVGRMVVECDPDILIVTSPHAPMFADAFHITTTPALRGNMMQFMAPQATIDAQCNVEFAEAVLQGALNAGIYAIDSKRYGGSMDHGTFVPLWFVKEAYAERAGNSPTQGDLPCPIVRIGLSGFSYETHRKLGNIIAGVVERMGLKAVFIASGDLSHKLKADGPYGFVPEGPVFDDQICKIFDTGKLEKLFEFDEQFADTAAECGLRSFQIMAGALEGLQYETELLSHEGTFGVGYGVATVKVTSADPCVDLARRAVEGFVSEGIADPNAYEVPPWMNEHRAATFVSLHERGQLRGCIGTIEPIRNTIAAEIVGNAISACSRDPRFNPVTAEELDYLEYSVDVLSPIEPISSTDELDVVRYGVIVTQGWKKGLLLPNLEGVDTIEDQVAIAKQKAGISPRDNDVLLERFEVVRHDRGGQPRIGA